MLIRTNQVLKVTSACRTSYDLMINISVFFISLFF